MLTSRCAACANVGSGVPGGKCGASTALARTPRRRSSVLAWSGGSILGDIEAFGNGRLQNARKIPRVRAREPGGLQGRTAPYRTVLTA